MQVSTDDSQSEERVDRSISSPPIQSSQIYQAAIATDDKIISNCLDVPSRSGFPTETHRHWYLGLSYLLAGKEDEAQAAWNVPLSIASTTEIDTYTNELALILDREAQAQAQNSDLKTAWTIRQHLWTISPTRLSTLN